MIPEFAEREDKFKSYLHSEIKNFLYDELAEEFCVSNGMDFLVGVPLPFTATDLVNSQSKGLQLTSLADNMVMCIGADTHFKYAEYYERFLKKFFDEALMSVLVGKAIEELKKEHFRRSMIYSRAALMLDSQFPDSLFTYACACREWYLSLEGDDYQELVALLKSDANEYFEYTVEADPTYAAAWYYMGYAYLNQAQYTKAGIAWNKFLALASGREKDREAVEEIRERVAALKDPIRIEEGINQLLMGRVREALAILEPYVDTDFAEWWPLHYYLGCAYRELGHLPEAIEGFRRVIALAPSHYESNLALSELYKEAGDMDMAEKYARKAELLKG
jgi:tetratricopeptide (TPR) repeat protein